MSTPTAAEDPSMRFTLTDSEREAVVALKEACDEQGVEYKHLFELAKYVLVSHSVAKDTNPKAPQIRLETALNRLKKRNKWVQKNGLAEIDPHAALLEVDQAAPGYFLSRYTKDKEGRVAVASTYARAPTEFAFESKTNRAKWRAAELYRLELAAADLEEARKGIVLATVNENQLTFKRAYRYIKLLTISSDNLKDMHSNRMKKIYSEVPSFLAHLISPAKRLLPKKIAERVCVVGSMEELHVHVDRLDKNTQDLSVGEWAAQRLEKYRETIENLTL